MVDNIKLQAPIDLSNYTIIPEGYDGEMPPEAEYCNFRFKAAYKNSTEFYGYVMVLHNLRITLANNFITIENSFHKYHRGNNYSLYSYTQLLETIDEMSKCFFLDPDEVIVKRFEFGININVLDSSRYLKLFRAYKKKQFGEMRNRHKVYGRAAHLSNYSFKVYDKTKEALMHNNIRIQETLRMELVFVKKGRANFIRTLSDLMNEDNIISLYGLLIDAYRAIDKNPLFDISNLTSVERTLIYAGLHPEFWTMEKELNKHTYKAKSKRYNKLMRKNVDVVEYKLLDDLITDAILQILRN